MPAIHSKELVQPDDIPFVLKNDEPKAKNRNCHKKGKQSNYISRIHKILNISIKSSETIFDFIKKNGTLNQFINYYNDYISNIGKNPLYLQNNGECNMEQCHSLNRKYNIGNKNKNDINNKQNNNQEKVVLDLFDILHIAHYHLIDIGQRSPGKGKNKQLRKNRDKFNKLRNINITKTTNNKFVTAAIKKKKEEKKENDDNINQNVKTYCFGVRFYYHEYYKYNMERRELLPGTMYGTDMANAEIYDCRYTYSDWYVPQKYASIKEEVLNSPKSALTIDEYNINLFTADMKFTLNKHKMKKPYFAFLIVYDIKKNQQISLKHILSIILYCDNTDLCTEFSSSFRKKSDDESDGILKDRHSAFANWAKYLREAVEVYGNSLDEKKIDMLYHGISKEMVFNGLSEYFCCPTSFSQSKDVSYSFSGDQGILLEIKNDFTDSLYWDCLHFSAFPWELECLFIGGFGRLEINGLTTIADDINHNEWVQAIKLFDLSVNAQYSPFSMSSSHFNKINVLMASYLKNENNKVIPKYVYNLFKNVCCVKNIIEIDIGLFNKDICFVYEDGVARFGYPLLKEMYFKKNNLINFQLFQRLFTNSKQINIKRHQKNPYNYNGIMRRSSIFINDAFMNKILHHLKHPNNSWKLIITFKPQNPIPSLNKLIKTFSGKFNKLGYELFIQKSNHPQFGSCFMFCIRMFCYYV